MIEQKFVDLFARGARVNLNIAERDVILTYAIRVLEISELLKKMIFKGGTALRKCFWGSKTRFSLDLDFTNIEKKEPDDIILEIATVFNKTYFDIAFSVDPKEIYVSEDKLSCGAKINYSHPWANGSFEIDLSFREEPVLPPLNRTLLYESYFRYLEFNSPSLNCFQPEELLAEKIRATYQRIRARDVLDLGLYAERPLNFDLIRAITIIKFWNIRDIFDPEEFLDKIQTGKFNWSELENLIGRGRRIDFKRLQNKCQSRYKFLMRLSENEKFLLADARKHQNKKLKEKLIKEIRCQVLNCELTRKMNL